MERARSLALPPLLVALAASCTTRVVVGASPFDGGPAADAPPSHVDAIDKVDLLFVVDNSGSMADKQEALSRRIPELMRLLTQIGQSPITGGAPKITDLHVAVITSSLGSQGTSTCAPAVYGAHVDDRAHLLPRLGEPLPAQGWTYKTGATEPTAVACPSVKAGEPIAWVLDPARDPSAWLKGADALPTLEAAVTCTVLAAGDDGCGYEMPLEAMYRFLADPAPALTKNVSCPTGGSSCAPNSIETYGLDQELLDERAAFLRPDSLLAIVLITDESDSSLRAEGSSWLPWQLPRGAMARGFEACAHVGDDVEPATDVAAARLFAQTGCKSCWQTTNPADDPACSRPWAATPTNADVDGLNLRAFHQLQRFGRDFLYPVSRYVDALTLATVVDDAGEVRPNPIFAGGRPRDRVVLAGIVGAPRALVNETNGFPKALGPADWEKLVSPDPKLRDPHMLESIAPRDGVPRFAGAPGIDDTNGGDRDVLDGDDLQYACLGPITAANAEKNGDCQSPGGPQRNPACLADGSVRVRAYPAIRPLRVIQGVGSSGYVASICDDTYRGAIAGIATKIGEGCAAK